LLGSFAYSASALEAGFVGSSSINLMEQYHNNTARLASAANPINGIATNITLNVLFRVPYLGYQAVGVRGRAFDAYANYNGLQVTVRKQLSHGFTSQGAYTSSKDMTIEYNDVANRNNAAGLGQQSGRPHSAVRSVSSPITVTTFRSAHARASWKSWSAAGTCQA
jgi:hypothetical protein